MIQYDNLTDGGPTSHKIEEAQKYYSGEEAIEFLTRYINKQIGAKVTLVQRSERRGPAGQEIDRALSAIAGDGIEEISSIFIVMKKEW